MKLRMVVAILLSWCASGARLSSQALQVRTCQESTLAGMDVTRLHELGGTQREVLCVGDLLSSLPVLFLLAVRVAVPCLPRYACRRQPCCVFAHRPGCMRPCDTGSFLVASKKVHHSTHTHTNHCSTRFIPSLTHNTCTNRLHRTSSRRQSWRSASCVCAGPRLSKSP